MSLIDFLSPALTTGTNAAAAYQGAQADNKQQDESNTVKLLGLLRQKQIADSEREYRTAETDQAKAHADYYRTTPLKEIIDSMGNVSMVPTRTTPTKPTAGQGGGPPLSVPAPTVAKLPGIRVNPPNQPRPIAGTVKGTSGMYTPGPGGSATLLRDEQGNPIAPVPPRARSGGSSGDMGLVHTMSSVRAQIDETRRALTAAQVAMKPLADTTEQAMLTGTGRQSAQQARINAPRLQQKVDSLEAVYSALAARQQREAGASPPPFAPAPTTAPSAPAPSPASGGVGGGGAKRTPAELANAKELLDQVLQSPTMSPDKKRKAQASYDRYVNGGAGVTP